MAVISKTAATDIPPELLKVPPFPAVAAKVLTLLSNATVDISKVAEVVGSDPTLTAHVLKAVNSYEYGLKSYVTDMRQAIGLLGLDRTRQIVVTTAVGAYLKRVMTAEVLRCWHHSIATAVLAEALADCYGTFADIAFVAGIMHDLGRLGLLVAHPQEYQRLVRDAEEHHLNLLELEEHKFGLNHAEAGRLLTEHWRLPQEFWVINGRHHDTLEGTEVDLLRIVHVACRMADVLGFGMIPPRPNFHPNTALKELRMPPALTLQNTAEELSVLIENRISTAT